MKLDNCSALVIGASAGIGREFARQLASRANSLVLVARRAECLELLQTELTNRNPRLTVHYRAVDLAEPSQLESLISWLDQNKINIDLLINNAGLGDLGPFATSDPGRNHQIMAVNMVALTSLTRALVPKMLARGHGAIVNVSSSAGFLPIAGFAVYAASKAYVNSFSQALRAELRSTGVSVTTLCPGPIHTEFQEVAKRPGDEPEHGPEFIHVSVEKVVTDTLTAMEADRALIIPGILMKIGMALVRSTPLSILRRASQLSAKRSAGSETLR
jgi:short-subunit dehydrogenase